MTKAAFLVGINKYPGAALRGCVPDIVAMRKRLTDQFDVPLLKTQVLLDGQATKAAILRGLQWLARQNADVAYFIFSGHGSRVPDTDGDEARQGSGTKYDQAIVPVDYQRAGFIIDDELGANYATFPASTRLIVHLDSCFSAKSERGLLGTAGALYRRHVARRLDRALPDYLVTNYMLSETRRAREVHRRAILPPKDIVLLSGCRDFETSADAYLGGQYRGAMTFYVEQAIDALGRGVTYDAIVAKARALLIANGFAQVPQLTGPGVTQTPIYQ